MNSCRRVEAGHFCAEVSHGNYIMNGTTHDFRVTSVPIMYDFIRGVIGGHRVSTSEDSPASQYDFECDWTNAMYTYDLTEKEVRLRQIERIREFQDLTAVQCVLNRTAERNGRPRDEHTDEVNMEITNSEEKRRGVEITWLQLEFPCEARECEGGASGIGPHPAPHGSPLPACDGPLMLKSQTSDAKTRR